MLHRDSYGVVDRSNNSEVDQFDGSRLIGRTPECFRHNDVCRFDIAMHESPRMHVRERRRDLPEHGDSMLWRHARIVHQGCECCARNEVEHEAEKVFARQVEEDVTGDDCGVVAQFRDGFGFASCAFDGCWRQLGQVDEFYRLEGPIELVDHLPNGSLAAFSQPFDEGVAIDFFPCAKFHKAVLHPKRVGLKWKTHVRCKFQFRGRDDGTVVIAIRSRGERTKQRIHHQFP